MLELVQESYCMFILINVGVGVICQDVVLCSQDFHSFLGIFFQLAYKRNSRLTKTFNFESLKQHNCCLVMLPFVRLRQYKHTRYLKKYLKPNLFLRLRSFEREIS